MAKKVEKEVEVVVKKETPKKIGENENIINKSGSPETPVV